jgi:hypothetical protein
MQGKSRVTGKRNRGFIATLQKLPQPGMHLQKRN